MLAGMLTSVPVAHAVPVNSGDASGAAVAPAPFEFPELPSEPDQAEAPSARSGNDGAGPPLLPPLLGGASDAPGNQEAASGNLEAANRHNMSAAAPGAALDSNGMPAIKHEGPPPLVQCGTIQVWTFVLTPEALPLFTVYFTPIGCAQFARDHGGWKANMRWGTQGVKWM